MSSNALAPPPRIGAEIMEKVMLQGDLKALTPAERVVYHDSVCKSLGLNPLTKPFEYLNLNGKLVLYARREATEQLRQIHNVNLSIRARELVEGCFMVTAMATLPSGRTDESVGVVSLEGLKGEARANAMMKAETKSKRRVTLSICGLGFLDESELDSVRNAQPAANEGETGEEQQRPWNTFKGMIERFAWAKTQVAPEFYYRVLAEHGVAHSNEFRDPAKALSAYRKLLEEINFQQPQSDTTGS